MGKDLLLGLLIACSCWLGVSAQQRKITGKVTAADHGGDLAGVSVVVKGTGIGTNTGSDGTYSIDIPASAAMLVFSFVGTTTREIEIGNRNVIAVALLPDDRNLHEIIVTAQGITREKRALGYAITTIDQQAIQDRPQPDIGRILQGKIAGLNVTSVSGVSGTGTNMTIRGYSSITGSNQPLFVVDGIPFNSSTNSRGGFTSGGQSASSRFLDIDPNNVENITVLKGLAATVTYGDQGRNGVILVTTKNGSKKARPTEYALTQSVFTSKAHLPRYQNDYVGGFQQNLGYFLSNWGPSLHEANTYPSQNVNLALTTHPYAFLTTSGGLRDAMASYVASVSPYRMQVFPDNVKDFFRAGKISKTSLNISAGGEKVGFNISGGYHTEQGYIPENGLKRLNLGIGLNAQLSKKLNVISSFHFVNTDQYAPPLSAGDGNNALDFPSVMANVLFTPRQVDLMNWPFENPVTGGTVYFRSSNDVPNPRWILKNYKTTSVVNRVFASTMFDYQLATDLKLIYKVGMDTYTENQRYMLNKGGVSYVNGFYSTFDINNRIWDNSLILAYAKTVGGSLSFSVKAGANMRNDLQAGKVTTSQNQLARNLFRHSNFIDNSASDSEWEETRMGIFGELTADLGNAVFLNVAGRNDWTSTVETPHRRIFYPSASLSFIPTSVYKRMESDFLNFLKLRISVGTSAGFPSPYSTRNTLDQNARAFLNSSGASIQTHSVNNYLGNPNLRPELHTEYEAGMEGRILNNSLSFDLTVFRRDSRNLITNSPLDASIGFTSTTINIGKIRNEGIELSINATPIKRGAFSWDLNILYARILPKVLDLGQTLDEVQISGTGAALGNYAVKGKPFNVIKGTGFRRDENGKLLIGSNGYVQSTTAPVILGDPNPAFTTSLSNTLTFKGISLDLLVSYRHGGAIYSSTAGALMGRGLAADNGLKSGYDRAQTFIIPGVKADGASNTSQVTASDVAFNNIYFSTDEGRIYDGSTIRLQELSLSYQLPATIVNKLKIKRASLSLTGNNLWYKAVHFPDSLNFDTDNLGLGVGNGLGFEYLTGPSAKRYGATLRFVL